MSRLSDKVDGAGGPLAPYRCLPVVLAVAAGVVLSLLFFVRARSWERERMLAAFDAAAENYVLMFGRSVELNLDELRSLGALYAGSHEVDRQGFEEFVEPYLARQASVVGLEALEWVPRVPDSQRAAYEKAAQQEDFPGFQFVERRPGGGLVRAPRREEYFPVYFTEPYEGNEIALGFDLASDATRSEALERARDTGEMVATGRVALLRADEHYFGFLVVLPIYRNGTATDSVEHRRENLRGFLVCVFRVGGMVDFALRYLKTQDISVYVFDASAPQDERFLAQYAPAGSTGQPGPVPPEESALRTGLYHAATVPVAGRDWHVLCAPSRNYITATQTWQPGIILASGLLFTVCVAGYILLILGQIRRSKRFRAEMLSAKQRLEPEIAERRRAEEDLRRLAMIAQQVGEGIAVASLDGVIEFANPAWARMHGYRPDEVIGQHLSVFHNEEQMKTQVIPANEQLKRTGSYSGEVGHIRRDGTPFPTRMVSTLFRDESGGPVGFIGFASDITERKQGEKERDRLVHDLGERVKELRCLYALARLFEYDVSTEEVLQKVADSLPPSFQHPDVTCARIVFDGREYRTADFRETQWRQAADIAVAGERAGLVEVCYLEERPESNEGAFVEEETELIEVVAQRVGSFLERRWAEEREQTSDRRYRTLLESLPQKIFQKDANSIYAACNENYARDLGIASTQLPGKTDYDFYPRELADKYRADDRAVMASGKTEEFDEAYLQDGEERIVHTVKTPVTDEDGNVIGILGIFWDITDRKQAEEKLRRLAMVAQQAAEGIAVANLDGILQFANLAWASMHGYQPEELVGKHLSVFHNEEQLKTQVIAFNEQAKRNGHHSGEVGHIRRDGTPFPTHMVSTLLRDETGQPVGFIGFASDITQQKQAEEKLAAAYRQLAETNDELQRSIAQANQLAIEAEMANVAKSRFLANMSHEIRTPMNAIVGMVELALDTDLAAEQREYLATVRESADSLLELINDILDLARVEAGKLDLESIDFHLRDSVDDTLRTLAIRAHEKGLELTCEVCPEVPDAVVGDPRRLRQVLTNLTGNAIKFTDEGQVAVRVDVELEAEQEVTLHFSVADTGIGILAEKQQLIFEAFAQVDGSATRRYGGTGLGLTISAQLVAAMDGRIWVESKPGQGSTFHFTVRLGLGRGPAAIVPAPPIEAQNLLVLVVDDNATNRRILTQMLTNWHMRPKAAATGEEGLMAIQAATEAGEGFALVLLDAHMPGMDGFAVANAVKQGPAPRPAIIMLTSSGQRGDAARCRNLGIAAYLTKPVKQSDLWDAILAALGRPATAEADSPLVTRHSLRESRRRLHILLAEDNAINQKVTVRMLEKRGHMVTVAGTGRKAVALLQERAFDLVLMDVQMPEMDGFEATAAIREQEKTTGRHLPIVAMTAHAMEGDRERCLAAGMDGYVPKPVSAKGLFAAIEEFARQAAGGQAAGERVHAVRRMQAAAGPPTRWKEKTWRSCSTGMRCSPALRAMRNC